MKKAILTLTCLIGLGAAFGQSNKVVTAFNLMKPEFNELDKAKQAIDDASVHPKTSGEAKTWYYRGQIYYKIFQSKEDKFNKLDPDPLKQAYLSFVKARDLDVSKRFEKELPFELTRCAADFFNKGSIEYQQKKYAQSVESFENAIAIGKLPYIHQLDSGLFFNVALAAESGKMYDKAIEYYTKSIEVNYGGSDVFHYLADLYLKKGDSANAFKTCEAGIKKYPANNTKLYIDLINFYLARKDVKSAFGYVEIALKKDSTNTSLWFVYAKALEDKEPQKAIEAYNKMLAIDPKNFDGYFNIGTIYYNMGVEANKKAIKIPLSDEAGYKTAAAVADDFFKQALPFYEKSFEIEKNDPQLLIGLSQIYDRFKMTDKLAEVKKLMGARK